MKPFLFLLFLLFMLLQSLSSDAASAESHEASPRILLVPLDDRPPCLQWPIWMASIAGAEITAPPRELLGRFMEAGDPNGLANWLHGQDLTAFDAAIISLDMLAYGGLVASRTHAVSENDALVRLDILREIRAAQPDLPVYGFNIIMRLAPTADGTNDAWRGALERWAELAPHVDEPGIAADVEQLEARMPAEVLADYKRARARNLAVNRAAIQFVNTGVIDYLILGQDDAKPRGVHVADRQALLSEIHTTGTAAHVTVQPGADEVAMLLLARVMTDRTNVSPAIHVIYSSEAGRNNVAPFEDRPLRETVSLQIAASGARETTADEADLFYYVFASRHENGVAERFAREIADAVDEGRRVIVADIDTRGNVQGGSIVFTEALLDHGVFSQLFGYASWNTAGNTLGTALPQGVLRAVAERLPSERTAELNLAHYSFLLQRLINDYAYHGVVRPGINRTYAREQGMNPMRLTPEQTVRLQQTLLEQVAPKAEEIWERFRPHDQQLLFSDLQMTLPWGRTFESEVDFTLSVAEADAIREPSNTSFTRHGIAAKVSRSRGAIVVETAPGEYRLAVWLQDHRGAYGILLIHPDNGETDFYEMPFTTWDSPFAVLYSSRGYLYSLFGHHFVEFDPRSGEFTHVVRSDDRVAMWMTEGDDGTIWAGNYPAAHVVSFVPETEEYTDYGPINRENWPQYPRAVATDSAGWVYTMIGFTNNHILALDPRSREIRAMVDETDRFGGNVTLWRGTDGNVYARMPGAHSPWLQLNNGTATPLDGPPAVERAAEISGHQGAFFGDLPDGRRITRLDLPAGWLRVEGNAAEPMRVDFSYPSDGSWIYSLAVGPDDRIYGSTGHPLRFFAYDPVKNSFWDTEVQGGHVNALAVQAGKLFGAIYTQGILVEFEPGRRGSSDRPNPRQVASAGDILLRPHNLLPLSDGRHLIQVGTPGYGRTGGGMMIYDLETEAAKVYEHTDLIEYHSTKALAELPNGDLIGGTSTEPGTGGERIAEEGLLYIMEWPSLNIVYQEAILPGVQEIRELLVGPDNLVYGLAVDGTFFVFDWEAREVVHMENLAEHYGRVTGGQAPRVWALGPNGLLYTLFRNAIVAIEPGTFTHRKLADTPVEANIGVALHKGRLYFASGSHLWSYAIQELQGKD